MRLYITRHGKAQRHSGSGLDRDRELAERGRAQASWLGEQMLGSPRTPGLVLTSPAARALQTAEIIAGSLNLEPQIEDRLDLGSPASAIVEAIAGLPSLDGVVLVGHNPTISIAVEAVCQGPGGGEWIELRTGQAALVELDDPAEPLGAGRLVDLWRSDA